MMKRMSSHLMTEWMAYHQIEPFGDELLDIHLANITAVLANANRAKGSGAANPKQFRLWKQISTFNPQEFFDNLKAALRNDKE